MSSSHKIVCPQRLKYIQPVVDLELIRIGNYSDGGYAMNPAVLEESENLLSFGLGENWTFEESLTNFNSNLRIEVFDHTVSYLFFFKKFINGLVKLFIFKEKFSNVLARFHRFLNYQKFWVSTPLHRHRRVRITKNNIETILAEYSSSSNTGLKIDIEGEEWEILSQISAHKESFTFIVIEIHDFDLYENLLEIFVKELDGNFYIAHLHANNFGGIGKNGFPRVFELTFLKRRSGSPLHQPRKCLPVPGIDWPNGKNRPDYEITF